MLKKLLMILLALTLCGSITVLAAETPDPDRSCSLTILMEWEGQPLDGGSLTICQVGTIRQTDGNYEFELIPALRGSGVSLEDLNDPETARRLAKLAAELSLSAVTAPISDGKAEFASLAPGLYVLTQTQAADSFAPIRPFLISLPSWDGEQYVYDLTANPKVPLQTEPTEPSEPTQPEPTVPDLPQTGHLNEPVPLMASTGLALFSIGWLLYFEGKRGHGHET